MCSTVQSSSCSCEDRNDGCGSSTDHVKGNDKGKGKGKGKGIEDDHVIGKCRGTGSGNVGKPKAQPKLRPDHEAWTRRLKDA